MKSAEPDRDEQVRAQPGLAVAQLALDADRAAERRGDDEPEDDRARVERREC